MTFRRIAAAGFTMVERHLRCVRGCDSVAIPESCDPKRQSFRRWTRAEAEEVIGAVMHGQPDPPCPACKALVDVKMAAP